MKTLLALLLLIACFGSITTAATEEKLARSFPVAPGGALVIDVAFGSIELVAEPARTDVALDVWRKVSRASTADEGAFLKDNPVEFSQDGNTVTVRARSKTSAPWSWFSGWGNRNEARYTVRVPRQFGADLKTSGGSIEVTGVVGTVKADSSGGPLRFTKIEGPVNGHTSGGGIKAFDCEGEIRLDTSGGGIEVGGGSGTLRADTSGGGITVKTFGGPVSVDTSGGGIALEAIRGKIEGDTSGGPIHATLLSPLPGDVRLETSGGGITVSIAADAAFALDAESSGGGVSCDLPLTVQGKIRRDRALGTVNGGGPSVHLSTSGGSVHIRKG